MVANADPNSGYRIFVHGQTSLIGGTSATSPLWAGLIARLNQGLGRNIGYLNPVLYQKLGPDGVLRNTPGRKSDISSAKGISSGPQWTPAAGWGSPDGTKLLQALRKEMEKPKE